MIKDYKEHDLKYEKIFRAAFHSISGVGSARLRQLISFFGSAERAWQVSDSELRALGKESWINSVIQERQRVDPLQMNEELLEKRIQTVIPEETQYPKLLRELSDAPPLLYYRGQLEPQAEVMAIVGSRKATPYGRAGAEFLAKELVNEGFVVVSGLARGIDTAAHKGTIAGKGKTWAVLGCGLDYLYPPENEKLAETIVERQGAIISEFAPGVPPEPQFFPMRNRIISGVARGIVVVEAALKSGALITVDCALEQGREVFAVPGPIFSQQSKGCHHLLRQGAKLVEGIEDILSELPDSIRDHDHKGATSQASNEFSPPTPVKTLPDDQQEVLSLLSDLPLHIDQITLQATLSPSHVALLLLELQLSGEIEQLPGQRYVLAHKC